MLRIVSMLTRLSQHGDRVGESHETYRAVEHSKHGGDADNDYDNDNDNDLEIFFDFGS